TLIENADYYIAPDGSDDNPGTLAAPFKTFAHADAVVKPGELVYVREGTYNEAVVLATSGTSTAHVRWEGYPGERAVVNGPGRIVTANGELVKIDGDFVEFRRMFILPSCRDPSGRA